MKMEIEFKDNSENVAPSTISSISGILLILQLIRTLSTVSFVVISEADIGVSTKLINIFKSTYESFIYVWGFQEILESRGFKIINFDFASFKFF